ncbi:MAG TPA: RNA methyltransferase [Candidatus Nanoarchaeia archaeon]|nr:RNA methyltransferase [Candidatus Nanoarchaeia archaeon]
MIAVILLEPKNAGNVGAVCRAMANFGFSDLVLINPKCNLEDIEMIKRAKHGRKIVKIEPKGKEYLKRFDYLIGTTARLGTDYNIPRSPVTPEKLAEKVYNKKASVGILFGREDFGLSNKEILKCDFVVSIPSSEKYRALNISHAVAIICYEIFKKRMGGKIFREYPAAGKPEKEALLKKIDKILDKMEFATKEKKQTQKIIWKRVLGKSFLTKREIFALHGFFGKIK